MGSTEEIAAQLVTAMRADASDNGAARKRAKIAGSHATEWAEAHASAALVGLRVMLDRDTSLGGPIGRLALTLADLITTYSVGDPELLLNQLPVGVSVIGGAVRLGVLTALTNVQELLRALLGPVSARRRYRVDPVKMSATLGAKFGAVELAEYLGMIAA